MRIMVTVSPDLLAAVAAVAQRDGRTQSSIVRAALLKYLEEQGIVVEDTHPIRWGGKREKTEVEKFGE